MIATAGDFGEVCAALVRVTHMHAPLLKGPSLELPPTIIQALTKLATSTTQH